MEELNKKFLSFLAAACREAPADAVVNGTRGTYVDIFQDFTGTTWEIADFHVRGGDAIGGSYDFQGKPAIQELQLDFFRSCREVTHTVVVPTSMKVAGIMGPATCIYATDGPPGLSVAPKKDEGSKKTKSGPSAEHCQTLKFPGRTVSSNQSAVFRLRASGAASARKAMNKRRVQSKMPEYFCLFVPCCTVTMGMDINLQEPTGDFDTWPKHISAVILGGRIDGMLIPAKCAADASSCSNRGLFDPRHCTIWRAAHGEKLQLNFHGVHVDPPKQHLAKPCELQELLEHLDSSWVNHVHQFSSGWSLVAVEVMDSQAVLRELQRPTAPGVGCCPECQVPMQFISRRELQTIETNDAGIGFGTPILNRPLSAASHVQDFVAGLVSRSQSPAPADVSRPGSVFASRAVTPVSSRPNSACPNKLGGLKPVAGIEEQKRFKESLSDVCGRCSITSRKVTHGLLCPFYGARCVSVSSLCQECQRILEYISDQATNRRRLEQEETSLMSSVGSDLVDDTEDPMDIEESSDHIDADLKQRLLEPPENVCLAIEITMAIDIKDVPAAKQHHFDTELRGELRRVLNIPEKQIALNLDDGCLSGSLQIGFVHPELANFQSRWVQENVATDEGIHFAENLHKIWDRLSLVLSGGANHRFGSNAFDLLRHVNPRDFHWRRTIVAKGAALDVLLEHVQRTFKMGACTNDELSDDGQGEMKQNADLVSKAKERNSVHHESMSLQSTLASRAKPDVEDSRTKVLRLQVSKLKGPAAKMKGVRFQDKGTIKDDRFVNRKAVIMTDNLQDCFLQERAIVWAGTADVLSIPPGTEIDSATDFNLHWLVWHKHIGGIESVLSKAAETEANQADRHGRRGLHIAMAHCPITIISVFVKYMAPIGPVRANVRDLKGRSPLHYGVARGDAAIVECFLNGLHVHQGFLDLAIPEDGETALHIAAQTANTRMVMALLEASASVNVSNHRGIAPLHYTAAVGDRKCCEKLIEKNANSKARDNINRTPLAWALGYENEATASFFPPENPEVAHWQSPMRVVPNQAQPCTPTPRLGSKNKAVVSKFTASSGGRSRKQAFISAGLATTGTSRQVLETLSSRLHSALDDWPQDHLHSSEWPGNVTSLAVRWRGWSRGAREVGDRKTQKGEHLPPLSTCDLEAALTAEASCWQVGELCRHIGGRFCTTCWEYVSDDHPSN